MIFRPSPCAGLIKIKEHKEIPVAGDRDVAAPAKRNRPVTDDRDW
jgi:hypothetical protein